MSWQKIVPTVVVFFVFLVGCDSSRDDQQGTAEDVVDVVTEDIQIGIEKYIEEQTILGGGYFKVPFDSNQLQLKLVRVHTEYLANLGPRKHFACVDMVDVSGDVYDVDFFLAGDPGAMSVTETTVHKINGQPFYVWKQKRDKSWHRVEVEGASDGLLGVRREKDEFEFIYRAKIPEIADSGRMWIPLPRTDAFQTVEVKSIKAPEKRKVLHENEYGNSVMFFELAPGDSGKTVELRFDVKRIEKAVYEGPALEAEKYLKAEHLVPADEKFESIADDIVLGKKDGLVRARAIYGHVIERMRYIKYGQGWGKGDAVYACDAKTGNCTDFHSYFIALCRSVGIPARFAIGAAIPSERDEGGVDGYHCWAEFYADGKWWPVDISEADKCSSLSTYYFGHHPANRIELSRGRDIVVDPAPVSGPINFLAYPVFETDGKPTKVKVEFRFKRKTS